MPTRLVSSLDFVPTRIDHSVAAVEPNIESSSNALVSFNIAVYTCCCTARALPVSCLDPQYISMQPSPSVEACAGRRVHAEESLGHVGLVVWQSAFVLAELLLRQPPFGQWHDVRVVDLGTGTGTALMPLGHYHTNARICMYDVFHLPKGKCVNRALARLDAQRTHPQA